MQRRKGGTATYDGFESGDRGELFIKPENEAFPSMHLLDQVIKRDMSPMEARPRKRARGGGYWRLSGGCGGRTVDRVQGGGGWRQEWVLRGDYGRGRRNVYILCADWG